MDKLLKSYQLSLLYINLIVEVNSFRLLNNFSYFILKFLKKFCGFIAHFNVPNNFNTPSIIASGFGGHPVT